MATNFFDQQDAARRRTGLLSAYFALAVVAIVFSVYAAVSVILFTAGEHARGRPVFDPALLAAVAAIVGVVILAGTLYKIVALREGGAAVARLLGGRLIVPASAALQERKLLNVVEEMALASGTPVPPVYVLDGEPSINAFAAGFGPGDAVVAVSRGCLDHLTRDELQGVIAHEFSHLLNGDMRLNLRVIGLLHGILLLALIGQIMIRLAGSGASSARSGSNRDSKGNGQLAFFLLGLALIAIGFAGVFFGRLIKCAISRQREFLADASAVQFTRNPDGIAGALKKIGGLAEGSRIASPHAEEACHLFFSMGVPDLGGLLATHPPLVERVRRIDPSFDGQFTPIEADAIGGEPPAPRPRAAASAAYSQLAADAAAIGPNDLAEAIAAAGAPQRAHVDSASELVAGLPRLVLRAVREPFSARAVVYALLLDRDPEIRRRQLAHLEADTERGTANEALKLAPLVAAQGDAARLPLVELALPALRQLSAAQYERFRKSVDHLVAADRKLSLFEFALCRMLRHHLDRQFRWRRPDGDRYARMSPISDHLTLLLSALAYMGRQSPDAAARAFAAGLERFGVTGNAPKLLPRESCSLAVLDRSLDRLAASSPHVKNRILDACGATIASDGRVTIAEGELLRAIADSLDCPIPPLLAASTPTAPPEPPHEPAAQAPVPLAPS
jgi:Zn-dependent protease with chaperone function